MVSNDTIQHIQALGYQRIQGKEERNAKYTTTYGHIEEQHRFFKKNKCKQIKQLSKS